MQSLDVGWTCIFGIFMCLERHSTRMRGDCPALLVAMTRNRYSRNPEGKPPLQFRKFARRWEDDLIRKSLHVVRAERPASASSQLAVNTSVERILPSGGGRLVLPSI